MAVYKPVAKANVTVATQNGARYSVSMDPTATQTGTASWQVPVGQTITVTAAEADKVLQWENESDKILGKGATLDVVVTGPMKVTLVYSTVEPNQAFVEFVTDYGQVVSAAQCSAESTIVFPDGPSKFGYEFKWWRVEGETEQATQETIQAKISGGATLVTLKPYYEQNSETGSVTVKCMYGNTELSSETYADIPYGTLKTFTAEAEKGGYWFECWKDENGNWPKRISRSSLRTCSNRTRYRPFPSSR